MMGPFYTVIVIQIHLYVMRNSIYIISNDASPYLIPKDIQGDYYMPHAVPLVYIH